MKYGKFVYLGIMAAIYGFAAWYGSAGHQNFYGRFDTQGLEDMGYLTASVIYATVIMLVTHIVHYQYVKETGLNEDKHFQVAVAAWILYAVLMVYLGIVNGKFVDAGFSAYNLVWVLFVIGTMGASYLTVGKDVRKEQKKSKRVTINCNEVRISCK